MSGFLKWLATLPPFAQIPLILAAFVAVAGIVIFFIEIAPRTGRQYTVIRLLVCVLAPLGIFFALGSIWWAAAGAAVLGALFFLLDYRSKQGAGYLFQLVGFLSPAVFLLAIGLVYPTVATFFKAFMNSRGTSFVGFQNFAYVFGQESNRVAIINTIIWVLVVPAFSTIAGLAYAVFVDKARGEKFLKALVFMPMAISFVGASIIWKFVYDANAPGTPQIGLLNGIITFFGGQPVDFINIAPWNNLFLMVILIWVQTGFAMVVLSAAIKGVPAEQMEAAQLDGTNAWQRFTNVTVPGIRSSLIVVLTTISIASLKVFDIVQTMTGGANGTNVLANAVYAQKLEEGRASAFAVILFILVLPIIIYNVRQMRLQKEIR
ncbi:MAG: ABC transporter permease [Micrococcales bacterium 70-64]|nr:sugar ABC transporter permease [Leifsonia sp.]ODU63311.1 MAG: ABC transporter permease [Leifsonia sp. SCN 70-46]OJX85002.1 MAG: ABC transporter permease [Micrococcales bacterium 70-64]